MMHVYVWSLYIQHYPTTSNGLAPLDPTNPRPPGQTTVTASAAQAAERAPRSVRDAPRTSRRRERSGSTSSHRATGWEASRSWGNGAILSDTGPQRNVTWAFLIFHWYVIMMSM